MLKDIYIYVYRNNERSSERRQTCVCVCVCEAGMEGAMEEWRAPTTVPPHRCHRPHPTHLAVQTVAELGDAAGDLVKVNRLAAAIAFHNVKGHGSCVWCVSLVCGFVATCRRVRSETEPKEKECARVWKCDGRASRQALRPCDGAQSLFLPACAL